MVIRRVSPLSCAKIGGLLYALLGLIIGACFSLVFFLLGASMNLGDEGGGPMLRMLFGTGAIVLMPLLYGLMGLVGGAVTGLLYNLAAGVVGGIEIEVQGTSLIK
jgi:hypothetical protein